MRRIFKTVAVSVLALMGCATPGVSQGDYVEVTFKISKPRVDVEHLRDVVIEQPPFVLVARSDSLQLNKRPPTTAITCSDASSTHCEQTVIVSEVSVRMSATTRQVEGIWNLTYGSDVTAEYGITGSSQTRIRTLVDPTRPTQMVEIPFSADPGQVVRVEGPFDMIMSVSVAE